MNIRNIETFMRVAERESFTEAAKQLNYVQSTVTMQIQQLERELGYPLFDRIGRKISITPSGKIFMRYADEIIHIMQKASSINKDPKELHGTLRIGTIESLLFNIIIDILPEYREKYPNIKVELMSGGSIEQLDLLRKGRVDIVFITSGVDSNADFQCCYQRKENLIFVANPQHELAKMDKVSLEDIFQSRMVVTERSGTSYDKLRNLANARKLGLNDSLIIDSVIGITKLLRKDMSVSFLPEYSLAPLIKKGELVKLKVDIEPQTCYAKILHHKNKWIAPFVEEFINLIRKKRP
ncbi:MAG: LysR family transcriptional regulator [Bacillota bacterium]